MLVKVRHGIFHKTSKRGPQNEKTSSVEIVMFRTVSTYSRRVQINTDTTNINMYS